MKELRKRQEFKSLLYSWPSLIVLVLITFFVAKGAVEIMAKERVNADRVDELTTQAEDLKSRQTKLNESIGRLSTEEGIIEEIRRKYNMARAGEKVAIIVDGEQVVAEDEESPWYRKVWNAIIKRK